MYLEIPVAPSKSVVVGRYEVGNSSGSFQKVCSPQTWLCIFAGLSEVRCMCLGEFCRTTLWESPCTREYIHMSILPSLLPFLLNINVSPSLTFFQNSLTLCTRLQSVPPKGVGTNRCLQLLFQNTSSIISCLFLSGSRISPQPYYVCPPAPKHYKSQIMSAAVSVSLASTHHQTKTKDSAIPTVFGGLADLSIPLRLNIPVIACRFLQRRVSNEDLRV